MTKFQSNWVSQQVSFTLNQKKSKPFKAFQSSQSTKFCVTTQALQLLRQDPIGDLLHFASLCSGMSGLHVPFEDFISKRHREDMVKIQREQKMFLRPTKTSQHTDLSKQRPQAATGGHRYPKLASSKPVEDNLVATKICSRGTCLALDA